MGPTFGSRRPPAAARIPALVLTLALALAAGFAAGAAAQETKDEGPRWVPATPVPADSVAADSAAGPAVLPKFEVKKPTRSEADEMTLREIIARCVEGEKTKLAGHRDLTATATLRTVLLYRKKKEVVDAAFLIYMDDDGLTRSVRLGERRTVYRAAGDGWEQDRGREGDEDGDAISVEASGDGGGLAQLPFFLEDQEDYDFSLLERHLEGDHVIFRIRFTPRSDFKPLPSGTVYVDTDAFRIIHEEFSFEGQNPFPLLLGKANRISRQWRRLSTGEWVTGNVFAEFELKGGWTGRIPEKATMALVMDDYRFDQGYDAARFGER